MPAWCSIATRHEMRRTCAAFLAGLALFVLTGLPALAQLPIASDTSGGNTLGENNQRVLPISEAFPWHVSEAEPGRFQVVFNPAPEHYLYRHAFGFRLRTGDEEAQIDFRLPPGLEKTDQFFGDIIAYYEHVAAELDIGRDIPAGALLLIEFQGCADWGFCYPPQQAEFELRSR
ncbi:MAG: hypothetical protein F4234_06090 [Gammaproteobacteria bacterium]|nr:hypothetical protein [Gammaproteobacteria bacterium]MXZ32902.1 hypothetical protein [Gammaproteobacteria bacterium]MYE28912.1 hypothetical protein [Gammaproteobacteria bacterium]MYE99733.1 hypothetical protein [Gammaproteobacteria bacterium]MYI02852.1 hypothetical protein [Gammaproteobacteria bacterium]